MSALPQRHEYGYFSTIHTRWSDNDVYGHINNVTYYSYFDTVANNYLIHEGGLDIEGDSVIGVVVESQCSYKRPIAYPDTVEAGLRVDRLSNRSVRYGIAIFKEGDESAAAFGHFVHVFVARGSGQPVPIPAPIREALARLEHPAPGGIPGG